MSFADLVASLEHDTLQVSLRAFAPELALSVTIVVLLLLRMPRWGWRINSAYPALAGTLAALWLAAPWKYLAGSQALERTELFTGLLVLDGWTVFFRGVLLLFLVLFILLTRISGIPDREDSPDFYSLVLGATIGMCLMASANHLLIVFLGIEMASVPSYALAGQLKGRREASEAALKYSVYGAGAAGIMLYGISLVAGITGSVHLPTVALQLGDLLAGGLDPARQSALVLGGLMIMVGLAFKLSAVPFHFWCPDVFEGASAEVNAFLSVASKAAALALLVRVTLGVGYLPEPAAGQAVARVVESGETAGEHSGDEHSAAEAEAAAVTGPSNAALAPARRYLTLLVALLAAVTCTFGNLAAYGQTNIKRLLAYSTIAHAGYLMMPVAAMLSLAGTDPVAAERAAASLAFYVGAYLFMNLGAFAVVAFLRNAMRSEQIDDYRGLIRTAPWLAVLFSTILLSLIGIPPLAGFAAKFNIFAALVDAKLWALLLIGGLNTVISLFYYLRVVKAMCIDPVPENRLPLELSAFSPEAVYLTAVVIPLVALGLFWDVLNSWCLVAAQQLLS